MKTRSEIARFMEGQLVLKQGFNINDGGGLQCNPKISNIRIFCPFCGASSYRTPINYNTNSFYCHYCKKEITMEMYESEKNGFEEGMK